MAIQVQLRRGTTAQNNAFTGALGETTVDTDKKTLVVHDGSTAGGNPLVAKTMTDQTANGVLYLNGSKVLTTGSALTFDGTNMGVGLTAPLRKLHIEKTGAVGFGAPYAQFGYNSFAAGGYYTLGFGFTDATYTNPPVEIGAVATSSSGGTTADIVFALRSVTTNTPPTEQMRLTSTGLGIGTSSPSSALHIQRTGANAMVLATTVTSGNPSVYLDASGTNYGTLFVDRANAGITTLQAGGSLILQTNGANERMRIDSSGNVGIGTTSINGKAQINVSDTSTTVLNNGALYLSNSGTATTNQRVDLAFRWQDGTYNGSSAISAIRESGTSRAAVLAFLPANSSGDATERMRIDSSGNLLVGATSAIYNIANTPGVQLGTSFIVVGKAGTGSQTHIVFQNGNGIVGSITTGGSTTTYGTSSDYRLKENIQPMQNALATVAQLNPVTYIWKADGSDGQGFIAHELQAVVPDCVTGEKDAVDKDGKPVYQGVDTSFLVATLTAAIKELKAELDATKAEVAALKGV